MSLAKLLTLEARALIALVGGGGKSTMLFGLGTELAAAGKRVILTTTTKMGRDQADTAPTVCWSADTECALAALDQPGPVMLVTEGDAHKVTGPPPEAVDRLFAESAADYVIVEADGSRGKPLKAPASFEPVIPSKATLVVILMGIDAVGRPLGKVAHRVEEAQRFTGFDVDHVLTVQDCAAVLLHDDGALRSCPDTADVVVAITKVRTAAEQRAADELAATITRTRPELRAVVVPSPDQD